MNAVIDAQNVIYAIGRKTLVDFCSLTLLPGQMTIMIGPNGAGKSTFLKLMSGELRPSGGAVLSLGAPIGTIAAWRLACRRAVMAQAQRLNFPFAVHEVVRLGIEGLDRARSKGDRDDLVEMALVEADMLGYAARDYQSLSGGEQQRVQFARVLCQLSAGQAVEPAQALFLDEPIASLDLRHQLGLMDAVQALARKRSVAVLAVLHDLNLAAHYADDLIVMHGGQIVGRGAPSEVLTDHLIRDVFGVENRGALDMRSLYGPFILPQFCTVAKDQAYVPSG